MDTTQDATPQQPDLQDTQRALAALQSNQPERATFYLRRALGKETDYEEVGGHIFEPVEREHHETGDMYISKECAARGCELMQTRNEWSEIKRIAKSKDCPTPLEGIMTNTNRFTNTNHW